MTVLNLDLMELFKSLAHRYSHPEKVQKFLKTLTYNKEKRAETVRSAAVTYHKKNAHCLEASLLSAAILEQQGYPPLIVSLDSIDHLGHAMFVFKTKTGWGSVTKSREIGLHGREPRFRSIRDLVWSYYDPFIDQTGKIAGYTLLSLDDSDTDWRFSQRNLWKLEQFVVYAKHKKLKSSNLRYQSVFRKYQEMGTTTKSGLHWW